MQEQVEMKFYLKANYKLSGEAGQAKREIEALIEDANQNLLQKGAPKGKGAMVASFNLSGKKLGLEILSGRYVRAHDAILRLRKPLAALLGQKYRIGIRGIEVEAFNIEVKADQPLKELKIPFIKEMKYSDGKIFLSLSVGETELENRVPDRIINLLEEKITSQLYGGKGEHWELIWDSGKKQHFFNSDPTEEMIKRHWIKRGPSRGQWVYGPQITRIFRAFERIVEKEILEPLGYNEMIFPKLVTWEVWKRSGHLKGLYQGGFEPYFICPPKTRDPEFWEEVVDYYKVTNELPLDKIKEKLDLPIGGMCFAQCPPFWVFLQGATLPDEIFPVKVFDRSGTSHRYESGGIHGIERLDEFHRIELLFIGTPEQVMEHAKEMQLRYKYIFNEILDLEWRTAWVTPWFMAQEGLTGVAEKKEVGTIDYEGYLPYKASYLEFQNLSVNGDKYPKGFNVKLQSGKELWSGCSGIGLERWAAVFLAQKGFDVNNWPEKFRAIVGELPEVFKFL
ncbi:MAG: serine--tRNA ligase [Methanocellales archaeon]